MPNSQFYLDSATVDPSIFDLRPDYRVLLIAIDGIEPALSDSHSDSLLQEAETTARSQLSNTPVTELPHIASWREAYKSFGAKPNKTRNSLEALTRRAEAGLPRVNRLTDIYNAICVKHQIPLGGEDLDKYSGAPRLVRSTGKEPFEANAQGGKVVEQPDVGEVVWCDEAGVTCRRWNWRQGPRTALSDDTTRVLFILDVLDPVTDQAVHAAGDELVEILKRTSPGIVASKRLIGKT